MNVRADNIVFLQEMLDAVVQHIPTEEKPEAMAKVLRIAHAYGLRNVTETSAFRYAIDVDSFLLWWVLSQQEIPKTFDAFDDLLDGFGVEIPQKRREKLWETYISTKD